MELIPVQDSSQACAHLAVELHGSLRESAQEQRSLVLGLATGRTMVGLYRELVRLLQAEPVDLSHLTTFNLDEYLDLSVDDPRSFQHFMTEHLFGPLGLEPGSCHFPDAQAAVQDPVGAGAAYTAMIQEAGGLDMQLLGLGRNGHIAFNEPGSPADSLTRVVDLHPMTREDAAGEFGGMDHVPKRAMTMGLGEIRAARRLRLLAFGEHKSAPLAAALGSESGIERPLSCLMQHPDLVIWADGAARGQVD